MVASLLKKEVGTNEVLEIDQQIDSLTGERESLRAQPILSKEIKPAFMEGLDRDILEPTKKFLAQNIAFEDKSEFRPISSWLHGMPEPYRSQVNLGLALIAAGPEAVNRIFDAAAVVLVNAVGSKEKADTDRRLTIKIEELQHRRVIIVKERALEGVTVEFRADTPAAAILESDSGGIDSEAFHLVRDRAEDARQRSLGLDQRSRDLQGRRQQLALTVDGNSGSAQVSNAQKILVADCSEKITKLLSELNRVKALRSSLDSIRAARNAVVRNCETYLQAKGINLNYVI